MKAQYPGYFDAYIKRAIDLELLDPRLAEYDLEYLGKQLDASRDHQFTYLGLQTLYDRYFIHSEDTRFELPQAFFMRVSMGLAINEINREESAVEFYRLLSSFDFMSSTPTLFNSGTLRPQLSSCYLTTVPDDLDGIFSSIKDDALLSKYAGGLGNDWTRVRGMGAHIKGTNGKSQGVVPFLKVANDTAVAVNQGGKRKGAMCAYLESWHIDIEEFLDLRKNTGDDRRRTHDMNTANWIPDLFMKRVAEDKEWTLFSPNEAPDLHELCGKKFEKAYVAYEEKAANGEIRVYKTIKASALWRKMISMLFETGHPWVTFKDPCNLRYSNQHVGVVHSSNLCTEIMLHTNDQEIAVCNLGSVNLPAHINENGLDTEKLEKTINTAMRMLDNVIDYNFYSVPEARDSTCATVRWAWASWDSRMRCINSACLMLQKKRSSLPTVPWKRSATMRSKHQPTWLKNAAVTLALKVLCGAKAYCRSTHSITWPKAAAVTWKSIAAIPSTGTHCATRTDSRYAQLQHHGDRTDSDYLQYLRRQPVDRTDLPEPVC